MGRQFGKVSPAKGGRFFAWVTDGATPDELAAIKGNVPGPVLMIISGVFGRSSASRSRRLDEVTQPLQVSPSSSRPPTREDPSLVGHSSTARRRLGMDE